MRKLALAALAAIALVCPAAYGIGTPMMTSGTDFPAGSGTLTTITTDRVTMRISGTAWASARFKVTSAGTATATAQISIDGNTGPETNFFPSAYAKRISTATANPTVQAISATALVTGDEWEVPLPSNATSFSIVCGGSGTTTTVSLYGGMAYAPGAPLTAVLYDTTSGVNTALDTGTVDLSGWEYATAEYTTPAGGSGTISRVDDAGTSGAMFTVPASAGAWYPFVVASPSVSQVTALPATGSTGALPIQKRMRFQSAAVAALTSRIRIEARR